MAELKTRVNKASVAKFLGSIEDEQIRKDCKTIAAMMAEATGRKAEMWGTSIIGFGRMTYHGRSGSSDWMEVGFSPRKAAITLYLMIGFGGFKSLLAKLGAHKTGGGCLYVKRLADVNPAVLNKVVVQAVKGVRARARRS